jgi:pimeloyl-ACP methyl ester carboxylesterase
VAVAPPSKLAAAVELPRAAWSAISHAWHRDQLRDAPRGDGRPIMVLPGLVNADLSNFVMRGFLNRLGYRAFGWGLGRNFGVRAVGPGAEKLIAKVEKLHAQTGEKVTLIGVSLGGIMARIVAHRRPDLVREVITVSSPYAGPPTATNVWMAFELLTGEKIGDDTVKANAAEAAAPPLVPTTAIWSRSDGLVNGMICHDDQCRSIEIQSSHMGVQLKPATLLAIAGVLAGQPSN